MQVNSALFSLHSGVVRMLVDDEVNETSREHNVKGVKATFVSMR